MRDHPRRCGENVLVGFSHCDKPGSPPQVRGKLCFSGDDSCACRITPAGAGKTWHLWMKTAATEDHPRRCGENSLSRGVSNAILGSPPQVRGKQINSFINVIVLRITPAGAGKTRVRNPLAVRERDHPRRCGENQTTDRGKGQFAGSPPQVRGKRRKDTQPRFATGITPAGAGKTHRLSRSAWEKLGSPPQVRGKRGGTRRPNESDGITPAGAGKTAISQSDSCAP